MTRILAIVVVSMVAGILAMNASAAEKQSKKPKKSSKDMLNHVVSFKFKAEATQEQIDEVVKAFQALPKKISEIKDFEWGTNVSPEKHDKGFTHGFILKFKTAKDRDKYLVHDDHKVFGSLVGPLLEDVFVIDFWGKE